MKEIRGGMGCGGRIWLIILREKDGRGRADGKPRNPPIPAGCFRFGTDEPEGGENPARSVFVQLKHAQNKFCGLAAEIQARITRDARTEG